MAHKLHTTQNVNNEKVNESCMEWGIYILKEINIENEFGAPSLISLYDSDTHFPTLSSYMDMIIIHKTHATPKTHISLPFPSHSFPSLSSLGLNYGG